MEKSFRVVSKIGSDFSVAVKQEKAKVPTPHAHVKTATNVYVNLAEPEKAG